MIDSWADQVIAETDIPYDKLTDTIDDVHAWIAHGTDLEDFTIDYITHLAVVRLWLPLPAWRVPTAADLWLRGLRGAPLPFGEMGITTLQCSMN